MKRSVQITIGLIIGIVLVGVLFRNVNWQELWVALQGASIAWIIIAVVTVVISFYTRIFRWRYVVRATAPASFRSMFSATQIGFLANFTLPGRVGEFIRPFVLSRLEPIPFSKALALTSLDRVTDLFGLIAVMIIAGFAFQPEQAVEIPEELLGRSFTLTPQTLQVAALTPLALSLGVIIVFIVLYLNTPLALRISDAILGRISERVAHIAHGMLENFSEGLHVFRSPLDMTKSIVWSLITWSFFVAGTTCMLKAFHLDFPWYTPFVVQTTLAIMIALPGAPGFIGQFQAGILAGLVLVVPEITYAQALAVGLATHVTNIIPVAIVGVYCLAREDMGLGELQRATQQAEHDLEEEIEHQIEEEEKE